MGKNDGSGKSIYGGVPVPPECNKAISDAMGNLDNFYSNTINGPVKSKDTDYPEQDKATGQ